MRVSVILVFVILALGFVGAAKRRDRLRTTTTASLVDRQFAFADQTEGQCQRLQGCDSRVLRKIPLWNTDNNYRTLQQ